LAHLFCPCVFFVPWKEFIPILNEKQLPRASAAPHDPRPRPHEMSDQGQSALESALIGCFGGLFATFCVYPLDLAKSKVSAHIRRKDDKGPKVTSIEVLKKILAEKGAAGLYEGMGGRALQCFVEDFVFFWCVHRRRPPSYRSPLRSLGEI